MNANMKRKIERPVTVGLVSLGCAKNRVDSEAMLGYLKEAGFRFTSDPSTADIIIVNTCGFIGPAKEESIDTILEMAIYKERGRCRKLIVTGCLAQRYHQELVRNIPEIDVVLGINDVERIREACEFHEMRGDYVSQDPPSWVYDRQVERLITTPRHYAYLKIAEGCNHTCTFCAIPMIRGRYRSRRIESIVDEARELIERGTQELLIISQDTTYYGRDLGIKDGLYRLLDALHELEGLRWIRLLYLYPDTMPPDFPEKMRLYPRLVPYLDLPLQHSHPEILRAMRRRGSRERYRDLLLRYRDEVPEIVLRTTFIVGFPGEEERHFGDLLQFLHEVEFDHVGAFIYSDEDGTPAERLNSKVPIRIAEERRHRLMMAQQEIVERRQRARVGKVYEVVIDDEPKQGHGVRIYRGRFYGQAPEIDGVVWVKSRRPLSIGQWVRVRITDTEWYDLKGRVDEYTMVSVENPAGATSIDGR